jgi:predicted TIM-barrel fold metal-dependent hydrolase
MKSTRRELLELGGLLGLGTLATPRLSSAADGAGTDAPEPTLEPDLPIIDPHHHLMDMPHAPSGPSPHGIPAHYLFANFLADAQSGHDIRATVIVGGAGFARADGPERLRVVGDTEFSNGAAAQSASGKYGRVRVGAGLVGEADLTQGAAVREVLEAHQHAGGGRFRGIRHMTVWSDDPALAPPGKMAPKDLAFHHDFQQGFAQLEPLGLSFDAWCYYTQLDGIGALAKAFPHTTIIMNHCGGPLGSASFAARRQQAYDAWVAALKALAVYPNVYMKIGGLGMWTTGLAAVGAMPPASSSVIAEQERPYIETCIQAFGVERCMFESNYPVEAGVGSYHTVWNVFKRVAAGYSTAEKSALFSTTAAKAYRLTLT